MDEGIDRLEKVARERAEAGSDLLLIFLLRAHRPGKFRERHEIRHRNEHILTLQIKEEIKDVKPLQLPQLPFVNVNGAANGDGHSGKNDSASSGPESVS